MDRNTDSTTKAETNAESPAINWRTPAPDSPLQLRRQLEDARAERQRLLDQLAAKDEALRLVIADRNRGDLRARTDLRYFEDRYSQELEASREISRQDHVKLDRRAQLQVGALSERLQQAQVALKDANDSRAAFAATIRLNLQRLAERGGIRTQAQAFAINAALVGTGLAVTIPAAPKRKAVKAKTARRSR
jgi:hypothetical protein